MFSLQKLLTSDGRFFDLLDGSAEEACGSVRLLVPLLTATDHRPLLERLSDRRREDKRLTRQISAYLCQTFSTPMDRENIESLAEALYRIPKTVEKFSERLAISPGHFDGVILPRRATMLTQGAEAVMGLVKGLRRDVTLSAVNEQLGQLQRLEWEADELMLGGLRELYSERYEPLRSIMLKDLYELLDKVFHRFRDVGNTVFQIVLKHS